MISPPWCPARAERIDVAAGRALAAHALPYFPPHREVHHDDERGTTMTDQPELTKAWRILAALDDVALHDIASVSVRSGVGLDACRTHLRTLWSLEYIEMTNSGRAGRGRPTMMWRRTSEGTHALARARARVTS